MKIDPVNPDTVAESESPTNTVESLRRSIVERLFYSVGKDLASATQRDWMFAVFHRWPVAPTRRALSGLHAHEQRKEPSS